MRITTFGTRGSLPVANPASVNYGGNTTCARVESDCLPTGTILCLDAGSGFQPLAMSVISFAKEYVILHSHYHHDHTQGMLIAPPIYLDNIPMQIFGPLEKGMGPREVYETIMQPPLHPVPLALHAHHVSFHPIKLPTVKVIIIHPDGGLKVMDIEQYRRLVKDGRQLPFKSGSSFPESECLVITMHYTEHPERTIAYRFDEKPTGRVFVFLTDEECRYDLPKDLCQFLQNADLLIEDAQYSEELYRTRTAGYGHGTPQYAVYVALKCGVKWLGLTHHNPSSTDDDIEKLVADGKKAAGDKPLALFACRDYQVIEL